MVVPLPAPMGLVFLEKVFPSLTLFCFVSMENGIIITNGLDGLAAGAAALAYIGMSIVVFQYVLILLYLECQWQEQFLSDDNLCAWLGILLQGDQIFGRTGRKLFSMEPFHRHLELSRVEEPSIVAATYVNTCSLIL